MMGLRSLMVAAISRFFSDLLGRSENIESRFTGE
jgi:hypothetical protein